MDAGFIVLAGGKSNRLGRDKKYEVVGGQPLLERVVSILSTFGSEIILVTGEKTTLRADLNYSRIKIVTDLYPNRGSAGGIYSGLSASSAFHNLVVACDMPFLNLDLLRYLLDVRSNYDLVVFRHESFFEPLHAVYSKNCLPHLEHILKNNLRIIELLKYASVRFIRLEEIERFDPRRLSFFNVNSAVDLDTAQRIASGADWEFKVNLGFETKQPKVRPRTVNEHKTSV
ncbi:MAG TPA: molybdenum cofactor guanylyltransferase [Dehalococcoidales bacterium]|nr:molybdenum cofactor guanylyltransferase [Dehalococcoidales bacterium]